MSDTFPKWSFWLTPAPFPSLRRLAIGFSDRFSKMGSKDHLVWRALVLLAPQLTAFALIRGYSTIGEERSHYYSLVFFPGPASPPVVSSTSFPTSTTLGVSSEPPLNTYQLRSFISGLKIAEKLEQGSGCRADGSRTPWKPSP